MKKFEYILHIASWYPNKYDVSNAVYIKEQVSLLASVYQSIVVAVIENNAGESSLEINNINSSLEEYIKYIPLRTGLGRWPRYYAAFYAMIREVVKKNGPPLLIHNHVAYKAGLLALIFSKKFNVNYIVTEHFTGLLPSSNLPQKSLILWYSRWISKYAYRYIAVSKSFANTLNNKKFKNIDCVYNFIDTDTFTYSEGSRFPNSFLHVSNLSTQKNGKDIVDAFAKCYNENNKLTLTIICSHQINAGQLKEYISHVYPNIAVSIKDRKNKSGVAEVMKKHETLLMFSAYETFSLVAAEAAICGMKVIATQCGGPEEFLDEKYHYLLPVGDKVRLQQTILISISNNENRKLDSQHLAKLFSPNNFIKAYLDIYKMAINI